jgi:hypothetical protein
VAEKTKNLGIRATPERRLKLKKLAVELGTSVQGLVDEAVQRMYFDADAPRPTPPPSPFGELTAQEERLLRAVLQYWREMPATDIARQGLAAMVKSWEPRKP